VPYPIYYCSPSCAACSCWPIRLAKSLPGFPPRPSQLAFAAQQQPRRPRRPHNSCSVQRYWRYAGCSRLGSSSARHRCYSSCGSRRSAWRCEPLLHWQQQQQGCGWWVRAAAAAVAPVVSKVAACWPCSAEKQRSATDDRQGAGRKAGEDRNVI
jgi:hypothetical protein